MLGEQPVKGNRRIKENSRRTRGSNSSFSNEAKRRFNDLLVESFIESADFGEVIIRFLELNTPLKRSEIADKPELFAEELESLLGDGAKVIEERMIHNLYAKIGSKFTEIDGYTFPDYVKDAKEKYLKHS